MVQSIPYQQLKDALDRAARFRRLTAHGMATEIELEQAIIAIAVPPPVVVNVDGWAKAGVINDPFISPGHLVVWWNPETNEVKVDRPRLFKESSPSRFLGDPLYPTPPTSSRASVHPFTAQPGYRYFYEGKSHSYQEAEQIAAALGTVDGWTWCTERHVPR